MKIPLKQIKKSHFFFKRCYDCGLLFGVEKFMENVLLRKKEKIHCPNCMGTLAEKIT